MNTLITTVTERGQVSIPSEIRKQLGLEPGQRLEWVVVSDRECRVLRGAGSSVGIGRPRRGFARQLGPWRTRRVWWAELRGGGE